MANLKKRALSLLMAVMMLLTALPMNAVALDLNDLAGLDEYVILTCGKEEVAHTAECYQHAAECYHTHEAVKLGFVTLKEECGYVGCAAHTHSVENGCPVDNCDAHAHIASCCDKTVHEQHTFLCCTVTIHKHNDLEKCYENTLTCTKAEGWTHRHSTLWGCYEQTLVCTRDEHDHSKNCVYGDTLHTHGTDCNYVCGQTTDHTHDADCYTCTTAEHTHNEECVRDCGKTTETLVCGETAWLLHANICKDETHHTHGDDCYSSIVDELKAELNISDAAELAKSAAVLVKCAAESKNEKCGVKLNLDNKLELVFCEEHFCTVCGRLNDGYCDCIEITFANIGNKIENVVVVKVANGEKIDAEKVPNAELFNYHFLGWFDANGNEFDAETVYTADITFTAQYKAMTEAEKLEGVVEFVKNNFDLGAELGRMITILSKGEITKESFVNEKDAAIKAVQLYLVGGQLTGEITAEQAEEILGMLKEGDEYTNLFAEWLWPENAVLMPEIDEILANIDFEKLAEEIKDMIEAEYGIEFTEEWLNKNRALAEQYITEALEEVKTLTEEQKELVLEQIAAEKAHAIAVLAMIRCEMARTISKEIENAKAFVKEILADTELGIRIGKNITKLSGLTNATARDHSAELKTALVAAIRLTDLTEAQQDALIAAMDENDGIVVEFIDWLWPQVTVFWMYDGHILEKDVVAFDAEHVYNGETPVMEGNDEFTYTFYGWEKEHDAENAEYTYTALFTSTVNEYTVTWMNGETVLKTESVPYGTTPVYNGETPVKEGNAQYTYTFAGWDKEITAVTGDVTYTATFTDAVNSYTVTFVVDGVETVRTYEYGAMPAYGEDPVKAADAQYTYRFAGWDKEIVAVTGDAIYTAQFTTITNVYTITFVVDGVKTEMSVAYGVLPAYGEDPTKAADAQYTYEFAGWDKEIVAVTGDTTYTALFNGIVNEYTVTWVDEDGTVLLTETYAYGETPVYTGATPFKAATDKFDYEFAGFGEIAAVTGDTTYTAQFTATVCTYRVTFKDGDKTLDSAVYAYGAEIVAPELPTMKGWDSAWNTEFSTVTGELTVEVVWTYKVFDSHKLMVFVGYGKSATDSTKGWFETTSGTIYGARHYDSYDVNGKYVGSTVMTAGVDYDSYTAAPGSIKVNGVTYTNGQGSSNDFYVINEYIVVATDAQYHLDCHATLFHTVTFVDYNGNVIETVYVQHGADVTAPADPTRKGYVFTGWDKEFTTVNESMTITAQYDYEIVESAKLKINVGNGTPASGSTKGNVLSHWGTIYNARSVYSYYDYPNYKTDSIMSEDDFDYARTIAEATPRTVKYDGVTYTYGEGSSDNYYVVTKATFVACRGEYHLDYKADFYNVYTFVVDGIETKVAALNGFEPESPADPEKEGYEFDGWVIDENGVYNAKFTKIHKVTFYLPAMAGGGSRVFYVRDGETVAPYEVKDTTDYDFKYWYLYEKSANNNHLNAFDFSTPITADTRFDARVEVIKQDFVVGVYVTIDGKNVRIGTGSISDIANPKEFYGIYKNVVQTKHYTWDQIDLGETFGDIEVNGKTFVYGEPPADQYYKNGHAKTVAGYYTYTPTALKVGKYSDRNEFYFYTIGYYTLYYRVTFNLPGSGGKYVMYVKEGEMLDEFWAEDYCFEYEELNYWYNSNGGAKLDFDTYVVTGNVGFSCKTKAKWGNWDVELVGLVNGESIDLGTAVINDFKQAGNYRNNREQIAHDASQIDMPEMKDIVVDGVTYTYGAGSSDNYYTVDFNNLTCITVAKRDWEYRYYGDIELNHADVVIWLKYPTGGTRKIELGTLANGTVVTTEWLFENFGRYMPIGYKLEEDVVITESGDYNVNLIQG